MSWVATVIEGRHRVWTHATADPELFAENRVQALRLAAYLNRRLLVQPPLPPPPWLPEELKRDADPSE